MLKAGILATAVVVAAIAPAQAAEVEVKMLTRGEAGMMVFEPAVVHIQPGDSVRFLPVGPGHNAESIKGISPREQSPSRAASARNWW